MKKILILFISLFIVTNLFAFPNRHEMSLKVRDVPKEITAGVFENPENYLPKLVKYLISDTKNDKERVKNIHDWICQNIAYDTDAFFSGNLGSLSPTNVLKSRKSVCSGYAKLFEKMCQLADIEAIRIVGWAKGYGYNGKMPNQTNHEWNAVKINGVYQNVDCCWDAGYVDYKTFIKQYSDQYLFMSPEHFLYTHLPEKDEYQFLPADMIKSKEQFFREPELSKRFFVLGLEPAFPFCDYTTKISGEKMIKIYCPNKDIAFMIGMNLKSDRRKITGFTWCEREAEYVNFYFDVPDNDLYEINIYAKNSKFDCYPSKFNIQKFEQDILPKAQALVKNKSIDEKSLERFIKGFRLVKENGYYIYDEDVFKVKQIAAITKIFSLLNINGNQYDNVLQFYVTADESYKDFSSSDGNYPSVYESYIVAKNTKLISPKLSTLKQGETYTFEIATTDFAEMGVFAGGKHVFLEKNAKGNYIAKFTIPNNADKVYLGYLNTKGTYSYALYYNVE